MRSADGIPLGPSPSAPALRPPIEPLRALVGPERDVIDGSIVRTVDQIQFIAREASRPLDFWANLALDNARHPPAHPVPYWSALAQVDRQSEDGQRRNTDRPEDSWPGAYKRAACECDNARRPSYAGPRLGDAPRRSASPHEATRMVTKTTMQHYAASGRLVDMLV